MTDLPPLTLLDGGLGTTLADQFSITFDDSTPLWSSQLLLTDEGREILLRAQRDFVRSGADVLLSCSYQASFEGFARCNISEKDASKHMRRSITIAQEAFNTTLIHSEGRVVLSLGAYGATMIPGQEYTGAYDSSHSTIAQLRDWHLERIRAFVSFGKGRDGDVEEGEVKEKRECWELVDLVAFETLPLLREVLAVQEVMFQVSSALGEKEMNPFWISCVFPGSANTLPDGSSIKDVVKAMLGKRETCATPMGIGLNCTKIGKLEGLIEEFEREVIAMMERGELEEEWPALVVYPDGTNGEVYNTTTQEWEKKEAPWDEQLFNIVTRARERRLWKEIFVGGCCKTTPEDIGKLRKRIDNRS